MWIKVNANKHIYFEKYEIPQICNYFNIEIDMCGKKSFIFKNDRIDYSTIHKYNRQYIWFLHRPIFNKNEIIMRFYIICG